MVKITIFFLYVILFSACINIVKLPSYQVHDLSSENEQSITTYSNTSFFDNEGPQEIIKLDTILLKEVVTNHKVILYVWAPWCAQCYHDIKRLNGLKENLDSMGVKLLKISVNYDVINIKRIYSNHNYDGNIYILDHNSFSQKEKEKLQRLQLFLLGENREKVGVPQYYVFEYGQLLKFGTGRLDISKLKL